jgi:hypothetical protein
MQDSRKSLAIGSPSVPLLQTVRPATDFTIEAIMGRHNADNDRPSPQLGTTADCIRADGSPHNSAKGNQYFTIWWFDCLLFLISSNVESL